MQWMFKEKSMGEVGRTVEEKESGVDMEGWDEGEVIVRVRGMRKRQGLRKGGGLRREEWWGEVSGIEGLVYEEEKEGKEEDGRGNGTTPS